MSNENGHSIRVELDIDLDRYLAGATRYNEDGEPVGHEPATLETVVLDAVVRDLVRQIVGARSSNGAGGWYDSVHHRIAKVRDEVIREQVAPIVAEALGAGVQQTDQYGEPTAKPTTLRALIVKDAKDYLTKRSRDGGYNSPESTPVQRMIRDEVAKAVKADLADALAQARAEVAAAVQAEAAVLLAETIKRAAVKL